MRTVYKYPLKPDDYVTVDLPLGAELLSFQCQHDVPCLWVLVDPNEKRTEQRLFRFAGTGHDISDSLLYYVGTAQHYGGQLVWHLFEVERRA